MDASFIALKALSAMHSLGKRISSVQFRVRAPQSSQRSGGFHKPAVSGAAPETATISLICNRVLVTLTLLKLVLQPASLDVAQTSINEAPVGIHTD